VSASLSFIQAAIAEREDRGEERCTSLPTPERVPKKKKERSQRQPPPLVLLYAIGQRAQARKKKKKEEATARPNVKVCFENFAWGGKGEKEQRWPISACCGPQASLFPPLSHYFYAKKKSRKGRKARFFGDSNETRRRGHGAFLFPRSMPG